MRPPISWIFAPSWLPPAAYQSVQFREIEFLSGLKDRALPEARRISRGRTVLEAAAERANAVECVSRTCSPGAGVGRRRGLCDQIATAICSRCRRACSTMTRAFGNGAPAYSHWSNGRSATSRAPAGSTGVAYLQSTLNKRFFPELWGFARSSKFGSPLHEGQGPGTGSPIRCTSLSRRHDEASHRWPAAGPGWPAG